MKKVVLALAMSLAVAGSAFAGVFDGNDGSKYSGPEPCGCAGPPGGGLAAGGDSGGGGVTGGPSGGETGGGNGAGVSGPEGVGL